MISKAAFNKSSIKCICKTPELIEGYNNAISDDSQTYICHHRLETYTSDGERKLQSFHTLLTKQRRNIKWK